MIAFFIVGMVIGALLGYTACALLTIAKQADRHAEQKPPKEKTKLLTVGSLVKWGGECHEMLLMYEGDDHQTYTNILNRQGIIFTEVPIEELEAVEE